MFEQKAVNILVVDDHPALAFGTKLIAEQLSDVGNVTIANDGVTAIKMVEQERPDIVLLDLVLPDLQGTEVARKIREISKEIHIIIYTGEENIESSVSSLMEIGISGLMEKRVSTKQVQRMIESVLEGQTILPTWLFRQLCLKYKSEDGLYELKDKDIEILKLVVQGKTNSEIAHDLYISSKTVENRLTHIYRQLDIGGRSEAIHKYKAIFAEE